jgi:hypothetical protein
MKRNVTLDIWRAVVVAGAMLAPGAGCGGKQNTGTTPPTVEEKKNPEVTPPEGNPCEENPCENPCARPRSDEEEPRGRGFILG